LCFIYFLYKGDSLSYHVGARFSTKDRDHDWTLLNCAKTMEKGGWWYKDCGKSNLNGKYFTNGERNTTGIHWMTWRGELYSLESVEMKVREYGVDVQLYAWGTRKQENTRLPVRTLWHWHCGGGDIMQLSARNGSRNLKDVN